MILYIAYFLVATQRTCTNARISSKIVGGFTCHPSEYPYLISLKTQTQPVFCGGSLLNKDHVLTAGHCCEYIVSNIAVVYAGLSSKKDNVQTAVVDLRIFHPKVDLCILRLRNSLRETSSTKFVKLADRNLFNKIMSVGGGRECITLGFGFQGKVYPNLSVENISQSRKLKCVYQDVLNDDRCGNSEILCAVGSHNSTQDACSGDSGGPLLCRGIQVGLVVAGMGCGLGYPSFYLRIPTVYTFIKTHSTSVVYNLQILTTVPGIVYFVVVLWQ